MMGICKASICEMVRVWKMIIIYTIIWIITTYKGKVPVHTKAYRGVELYPHSSLTMAPDVDEWSHHDLAFYLWEIILEPFEEDSRVGTRVGMEVMENSKICCTCWDYYLQQD